MSQPHQHRCMRCSERFDCQTPGVCVAGADVLPSIVVLDDRGQPKITDHCPDKPDWQWIREYGLRMQSQGWDGALAFLNLTPEQQESAARAAVTALKHRHSERPS